MTNDYNTKIIEEFRSNDGRVGGPWEATSPILVHDIGAKSGIEQIRLLPVERTRQHRTALRLR